MDTMKLRLQIEIAVRYFNQLDAALDRNDRQEAETALRKLEQELDTLDEETSFVKSAYWMERITSGEDIQATSPGYFVTLCKD